MGFFPFKIREHTHKIRCFYCNSSFSKKQVKNLREWVCFVCQAKNYMDNKGNIEDVPFYVANKNDDLNIRYTTLAINQTELSPFCQTCMKNHSFIVNALASYLPSEEDPDYDVYLSALPSYREFLEERYPMVCDLCFPHIQEHLAKKNYIAKSMTLGGWLLNSKKMFSLKHSQSRLFLWARLFIWGFRGLGWWIFTILVMLYYILGFFIPSVFLKNTYQTIPFLSTHNFSECIVTLFDQNVSFGTCLFLYKLFIRRLIFWGIFVILWDYTWVSQNSRSYHRVYGKSYYYICQIFIHIIRAIAEFILSERISDATIYSGISLALFFVSIIHLVLIFKCIYFIPPALISLYDSNSRGLSVNSKQKLNTESKMVERKSIDNDRNLSVPLSNKSRPEQCQHDVDSCDDFMQLDPPEVTPFKIDIGNTSLHNNLSFGFPKGIKLPLPPKTSMYSNVQQQNRSFNSQKENYFLRSKSNIFKTDQKDADDKIASQRFFEPEQPTGLETIFSPALRLDDEPLIIRALRIVSRHKLTWNEVISVLWALEIMIINILNLGKISYYSSIVGSFGIACSIATGSWFLRKTYIKLIFIGTVVSFFYYLFIYINHYDDFEIFLQTSKTFFTYNTLITAFYSCFSLRILWIIRFLWSYTPLKAKQEYSQKQSKIWGKYAYNK